MQGPIGLHKTLFRFPTNSKTFVSVPGPAFHNKAGEQLGKIWQLTREPPEATECICDRIPSVILSNHQPAWLPSVPSEGLQELPSPRRRSGHMQTAGSPAHRQMGARPLTITCVFFPLRGRVSVTARCNIAYQRIIYATTLTF